MHKNNKCALTKQLDELERLKKEYQQKSFHAERLAKIEKDPKMTNLKLKELRQKYLSLFVEKL